MAISPDDAQDLAGDVADAYSQAEVGLLARIASFIGIGLDSGSWSTDRRDSAGLVRRAVTAVLGRLLSRGSKAADKAAKEAERRGTALADDELGSSADGLPPPSGVHAKRGAQRINDDLRAVNGAMVTQAMNAYHRIITEVTQSVEAGTNTRLQAAGRALARFADEGITGFTDKRGHRWELRTYVEMAVRTHAANIMVDAHTTRLEEAGVRLVMVSDAPYECEKCKPWEGKVLEIGGPSGKHSVTVKNAAGGGTITVQVAGSLEEARSAGLFHPNCRHNVTGYLPGVTRAPNPPTVKATYKDTQRLREMERTARKWDRRRAVALTDEERQYAESKFREWRGKARKHAAEKQLPRKTNRERHDATR